MSAVLASFHFLRPAWLLALPLVPGLLWFWQRRQRTADPWRRICDPALLAHLSQTGSGRLRSNWVPWLLGLGGCLAILALAGPAFRQAPQTVLRLQSPLIVAVDLSDHMRATDLKPDRMARVRFKLADLLARRVEGQTALIAYAGDAFVVAPLTDDAASLTELAAALSPEVMPVPGQATGRAIDLAVRLLQDAGNSSGDLLILTDQVERRANDAARRAHEAGLRVSVLGIGTAKGAPIPQAGGGFLSDARGTIVLPRLDAGRLAELAHAGGGRYAALSVDDADLRQLGVLDARRDSTEAAADQDALGLAWHDEGPWLLLGLLPLAALAFRRGWLGCVLLVFLLPAPPSQAFDGSSLWQRDDQRAWRALQRDDAETARALARDPAIAGAAAYRAGDYADAIEQFAQGDAAVDHYNRGNALARAGQYPEAIQAYDEALARQPDFADARANRQAVEDWLRQQPPDQGSQDQPDQDQQQGEQDRHEDQGREDGSASPEHDEGEESDDGDTTDAPEQPAPGDDESEDEPRDSGGESAPDEDEQQAGSEPEEPSQSSDQDADADPAKQSEHGERGDNPEPDASQAGAPDEEDAQDFSGQMQEALDRQSEDAAQAEPETAPLSNEEAEQQQAMEQLLRRVPDDPGGLLRRKFQLEYQRRQQRGDLR